MTTQQEKQLVRKWTELFIALKQDIGDEYRVSNDPDDTTPGMSVTIGCDTETGRWSYQTGDNSYSGGAYGFAIWCVVSLYRRSNSRELAKDCLEQIMEQAVEMEN